MYFIRNMQKILNASEKAKKECQWVSPTKFKWNNKIYYYVYNVSSNLKCFALNSSEQSRYIDSYFLSPDDILIEEDQEGNFVGMFKEPPSIPSAELTSALVRTLAGIKSKRSVKKASAPKAESVCSSEESEDLEEEDDEEDDEIVEEDD